jgi:hypothetical protein
MYLYLIEGYLDVAAVSLADAKLLFSAMDNPGTAANAAVISRVTDKVATLVQSDSGEPLVISSIADGAGTISSWVTDPGTTLSVALGDPDPSGTCDYTSTTSFSIVGSTRTGTLALNTTELRDRLAISVTDTRRAPSCRLTLQVRKSTSGATETLGLIPLGVVSGVLS